MGLKLALSVRDPARVTLALTFTAVPGPSRLDPLIDDLRTAAPGGRRRATHSWPVTLPFEIRCRSRHRERPERARAAGENGAVIWSFQVTCWP